MNYYYEQDHLKLLKKLESTEDVNFLCEYLKDKSNIYKCCVMINPNCPVHILYEFANSKDSEIRRNIVLNKNCPISILNKLIYDKNFQVRYNVIKNSNCTADIFDIYLSENKIYNTRNLNYFTIKIIAGNDNCTNNILEKIIDIIIEYFYSLNSALDINIFDIILKSKSCDFKILKKIYKFLNVIQMTPGESLMKQILSHPNWRLSDFE